METGHVYTGGNPFTGFDDGGATPPDTGYVHSSIQAAVNASPQDFGNNVTPPVDGLGMAGMGLYGDYELFIPAATLTRFPLSQMDDVVLHLQFTTLTNPNSH